MRKTFVLGGVLLFAFLGLVVLGEPGYFTGGLRLVVAFVFLTFIPGIIMLRLLKVRGLSLGETIVYSTGLSLAFLMLVGLLVNWLYPYMGISRPISLLPLAVTFGIIVLTMGWYTLRMDRRREDKGFLLPPHAWREALSPPALFLLLLIPLSVLGAMLMNATEDNRVVFLLLGLIALAVVLVASYRFIPRRLYPLMAWSVALSLLFHRSLISPYLAGYDIYPEYYLHKVVEANAVWNSTAPSDLYNSVLSVTILPTIYSLFLGIEGTAIFKVIFPFFASLVPLALYEGFRRFTGERVALLAVFLFVQKNFFTSLPELGKQTVALLFLALIVILLVSEEVTPFPKRALLITFGFGMVSSHYGLSYVFLFMVLPVALFLSLRKRLDDSPIISFALLFAALALTWYMYYANSAAFNAPVLMVENFVRTVFTDFLNPQAREPLLMLLRPGGTLGLVSRLIHLLLLFFTGIGILKLLLRHRDLKLPITYAAFSLGSFIVLAAFVLTPGFGELFGTWRLYLVLQIFLAPVAIIGGLAAIRFAWELTILAWHTVLQRDYRRNMGARLSPAFTSLRRGRAEGFYSRERGASFIALSVILVTYFLFNTGVFFELANQPQFSSPSLNAQRDFARFTPGEVAGARWLTAHVDRGQEVFGDAGATLLWADRPSSLFVLFLSDGKGNLKIMPSFDPPPPIYLRRKNIREGKLLLWVPYAPGVANIEYAELADTQLLTDRGRIYGSGDAQVYR